MSVKGKVKKLNKKIEKFKYEDTDGNDITVEIDFDLLEVLEKASTYNYKNEIISRNKVVGKWKTNNKKKIFNILKNNVGDMPINTEQAYQDFLKKLENKYKVGEEDE